MSGRRIPVTDLKYRSAPSALDGHSVEVADTGERRPGRHGHVAATWEVYLDGELIGTVSSDREESSTTHRRIRYIQGYPVRWRYEPKIAGIRIGYARETRAEAAWTLAEDALRARADTDRP